MSQISDVISVTRIKKDEYEEMFYKSHIVCSLMCKWAEDKFIIIISVKSFINQPRKNKNKSSLLRERYLVWFVLEPSRILDGSNNSLDLQVIVETVDTFLSSNPTHLVPSEWNCGIKHIETVYPNASNPQRSHQPIRCVQILREHSCS